MLWSCFATDAGPGEGAITLRPGTVGEDETGVGTIVVIDGRKAEE